MRSARFRRHTAQPLTYHPTMCLLCLLLLMAAFGATAAVAQYPPNGSTIPAIALTGGGSDQHPPSVPPPAPADQQSQWNMELLGFNDLQGRSAYQPLVVHQGAKEILYVGHHAGTANPATGLTDANGTSIIDVTNPKKPVYLRHLTGPTGGGGEAGGAQMVRVCDGGLFPNSGVNHTVGHWYMLRNFGSGAHQVWDVTDPANPSLVSTIGHQTATHKNWWECDTGIAYLVGNSTDHPGWHHSGSQQHVEIYDLSNPGSPRYIRDYGLPGQQPSATAAPFPPGIHGPISAGTVKNRVYLAYGVGSNGVIQIVDRDKLVNGCAASANPAQCPDNPSAADLLYPQVGVINMSPDQGGHSSYPVFGVPLPNFQGFRTEKTRDLVLVASESTGNGCQEAPHFDFILDITNESKPMFVSTMRVPENPGDFCNKGARFGAHSVTETLYPPYYGKLLIGSWFNAGVRVFDIRDPFRPQPIAYFIPAPNSFTTPSKTTFADGSFVFKTAIMTNNAEVDDRGYIYIVDRVGTGVHILQLTGRARQIVTNEDQDDDEH